MSSYSPGLPWPLPPVELLAGPHGLLAFAAYEAERPWLRLLISHGFGEHLAWYRHVVHALRDAGISTYIYDQYHHGRSAGRPGDVTRYADLVDGADTVRQHVQALGGDAPLVLLGHSNGGLVGIHLLQRVPRDTFAGMVLCSPFLGLPHGTRRWGLPVARLLKALWPTLMVPLGEFPEFRTPDETLWPQYARDPLRFRRVSVRFVCAMAHAAREARAVDSCHDLPLLLLSGDQEQVVDPAAARHWFDRLHSADKTFTVYPGQRHELFNAPIWSQILADIVTWLGTRFRH